MKITPGPWRLGSEIGIRRADGTWVGEPCRSVFANDETESWGPTSICTARAANAQAIAALPELLEAVALFNAQLPSPIPPNLCVTMEMIGAIGQLRAALKKARGE